MSELVLTLNPKILQYLWKPLNLLAKIVFILLMFLWLFLWKGYKISSIWTLKSLCKAFLSSCLYSLCSYDYCEKGTKIALWGRGGVFFNPKILIKASPSMRISQSPCQVFPNLCFCNFMFLWLFLWKGAKIAWGTRGLLFLTPKSLLKHSHLWEQLNLYARLSRTHVSAVLSSYD